MYEENNSNNKERNEILDNEVASQCLRDEAGWMTCCCPRVQEIPDDSSLFHDSFGPSSTLNFKDKSDLIKLCEFNDDFKWRLLYRGTRDGFLSKEFHKRCDKHINTLIIIKTDLGYIS